MFEKEAEEYTSNLLKGVNCNIGNPRVRQINSIDVEEAYQKGAEFGYNKANEWHKDLPTEDVELAIIEVEDCGYLLCEYRKGVWYDKGSSAVCKDWITRNIKRWKEIVLPKESE